MKSVWILGVSAMVLLIAAGASPSAAYQRPGRTERVSVASDGAPANDISSHAVISDNGRSVAFTSDASNLVPRDQNLAPDVFVHNRRTRTTSLVSVSSEGIQANGPPLPLLFSDGPSISATGRYVAFYSNAINLVPGDTNLAADAFVHDVKLGRTERVSVSSDGDQAQLGAVSPSISADGRFVVFDSRDPSLVKPDANGTGRDVFVHDRRTGKTELVTVASDGTQQEAASRVCGSISPTGRYVVFESSATNLVPDDTNVTFDTFVHDRQTGKTERVSVNSAGEQSAPVGISGSGICGGSSRRSISTDGRYVSFTSNADNLVPNGTKTSFDGKGRVYVYDRKTNRTRRVSVSSTGAEADGVSYGGSMRPNGRHVAFTSFGNNLVPGDSGDDALATPRNENGDSDVFVHDLRSGATEMVDVDDAGREAETCRDFPSSGPRTADNASLSGDGRFVSFESCASNLVDGDEKSPKTDIFVRESRLDLGVANNLRSGALSVGRSETFSRTGYMTTRDQISDVDSALTQNGANLYGVSLAYRPQYADLFARVELEHMPSVVGIPGPVGSGILYGFEFSVNGADYQLRAQRIAGSDYDADGGASFGLFRRAAGSRLWTKVGVLKGGYGTTGVEVVFALPLEMVGLETAGTISQARAFTAAGAYDLGVVSIIDSVRLR